MEDEQLRFRFAEPLLQKEAPEKCPGCNTAYLRKSGSRPPRLALVGVALLSILNALPLTSLYPFLYFMVHDFHIAKSNDSVGYYVGIVGSSFMVGRFLTSAYWGVVSDHYGRKVVIYIGVLSIIIFNTLFGLSTSFWMALASRFFLGIFNGMVGSVQAYASEICSHEYHAYVLSVISTMWGLGLIIGPALGGYLAQPVMKYPKLFTSPFFVRFPYSLPCFFITICAIPLLGITFQMPETVHRHEQKLDGGFKSMYLNDSRMDGVNPLYASIDMEITESGHKVTLSKESNVPRKSIYKNWGLMASIVIYCIWSMHDVAYIEIFSLWAVSSQSSGGLSLTSSEVGQVLAISGFCMLFFQMVLFPPVANFLGPVIVTRVASVITIPLLGLYPFISTFSKSWLWVYIVSASVLKNILSVAVYTSAYLLMNNSVTQDQRGAASGLSTSAMSIFIAVGPAGGGAIFAWSQTRSKTAFLPGNQIVFFFLYILAFITFAATFEPFLPHSLDKQIEESHQPTQGMIVEPLLS